MARLDSCSSAPLRLRSASNSPCPRFRSSSPVFLSRDPPAAARVKRAVPVNSSWADRFIKHHPRSARGMILSQLNKARSLRPGPLRSQAPLKLHCACPYSCAVCSRAPLFHSRGERIEPAPASPRWANSILAEQEDRAPVLMKACSHEGWDPCPASRGAAGSTPWRPDRGHQVQPRTCPRPGRRRNRRCPLWMCFEPSASVRKSPHS